MEVRSYKAATPARLASVFWSSVVFPIADRLVLPESGQSPRGTVLRPAPIRHHDRCYTVPWANNNEAIGRPRNNNPALSRGGSDLPANQEILCAAEELPPIADLWQAVFTPAEAFANSRASHRCLGQQRDLKRSSNRADGLPTTFTQRQIPTCPFRLQTKEDQHPRKCQTPTKGGSEIHETGNYLLAKPAFLDAVKSKRFSPWRTLPIRPPPRRRTPTHGAPSHDRYRQCV